MICTVSEILELDITESWTNYLMAMDLAIVAFRANDLDMLHFYRAVALVSAERHFSLVEEEACLET